MTIYDPSPEEVEVWVLQGKQAWPEQDWDYHIINGRNDELILTYANDEDCDFHDFFVHCLYLIVGEFREWYPSDQNRQERITKLLQGAASSSQAAVQQWATETRSMLAGEVPFVLSYWIDHLYFDQIEDADK